MTKYASALAALALVFVIGPAATGAGGPPQGYQSNDDFAASYTAAHVTSTDVTAQQTSCYTPEVYYQDDPWGNFYSLVLAYSFRYDKAGNHKYDNGSNQTNSTVPPEVVAVSIRPKGATTAKQWDSTNGGAVKHDYLMTAKNANTSDPDKQ